MPMAYYLVGETIADAKEFPIAERIQSSPQGRRSGAIGRRFTDIEHITEEGVYWIYPLERRRSWQLTFRIYTEEQLQFFETRFLAVNGRASAWHFLPDVDDESRDYLVRDVRREFMFEGVDATTDGDGNIVKVFDYVLEFEEESEAAQVLE